MRLQPELKSRLEDAATKAGRSLNAEIAARLEESFEAQEDARLAVVPIMEKLDALTQMLSGKQREVFADAPHDERGNNPPKKPRRKLDV